jgi:quinol-cytochrome oxidoreductase complex cytochrome b subunit
MALSRRPRASVEARDPNDEVFAWPHLLYRELLVALGVIVALHAVSLIFMAPLEEMADPTRTPNPAKAPWYFLGLQELVHYSALMGGVIIPTLLVLALLVLPYVDRDPAGSGRWFAPQRRIANIVFTTLAALFIALTFVGTLFRGPNWAWVWPWK